MAELGIWVIKGKTLLEMLHKAYAGQDPEMIYAEAYANADIQLTEESEL